MTFQTQKVLVLRIIKIARRTKALGMLVIEDSIGSFLKIVTGSTCHIILTSEATIVAWLAGLSYWVEEMLLSADTLI